MQYRAKTKTIGLAEMIDFVVEIRFAPTERSEGIVGALSRSSDRFELQSIKQLTRSNFDVGGSVRSMTHRFYGVRAVCGIQIISNNIVNCTQCLHETTE